MTYPTPMDVAEAEDREADELEEAAAGLEESAVDAHGVGAVEALELQVEPEASAVSDAFCCTGRSE
jgi:hypothetical protein